MKNIQNIYVTLDKYDREEQVILFEENISREELLKHIVEFRQYNEDHPEQEYDTHSFDQYLRDVKNIKCQELPQENRISLLAP